MLLILGLTQMGMALAQQTMITPILPEKLQWTTPPNLPAVRTAWLVGGEQQAGSYAMRVVLANNGRIPPHTHPDTRYSTVLSGTLYVGLGSKFDATALVAVPAGAVYVAPAGVGPTGTRVVP